MLKKLDLYIIKTFFAPFLLVFSVLMFIFVAQFAFIQLDVITGKGLTFWDIAKFLYYLGLEVIRQVLPLTILLAAIMTFGGFGERYELAAMKSAGISLPRIMAPLIFFVVFMSVWLFYFSNQILPTNQKKARNMLTNIMQTRPALNFVEGKFMKEIPGFSIKIAEKKGDDGSVWKDVFIHKSANSYQNKQTIIAERGLLVPFSDKHYLRLELYDGYVYEDNIEGKRIKEQQRQPYTQIKFDTLTQFFDTSELVRRSLESDSGQDHYKFKRYNELGSNIDSIREENYVYYQDLAERGRNSLIDISYLNKVDSLKFDSLKVESKTSFIFDELKDDDKYLVITTALNQIDSSKKELENADIEIKSIGKYYSRIVMWQQRIVSYSVTCLVFFFIGAPLGSIIRKGGIGMPVVVAIIIFILFYVITLFAENKAKILVIDSYLGAWLPNIILLPLGVIFTIKSMQDSDIFNLDNYLEPFRKLISKFSKNKKTEHSRYQ